MSRVIAYLITATALNTVSCLVLMYGLRLCKPRINGPPIWLLVVLIGASTVAAFCVGDAAVELIAACYATLGLTGIPVCLLGSILSVARKRAHKREIS